MADWSDLPEAWRLVGGRKRHNHERQLAAATRRRLVVGLLVDGLSQAEIARRVGVHRATICRDAAWLGKLPEILHALPATRVSIGRRGWRFEYG
jgi:hypothetical protein